MTAWLVAAALWWGVHYGVVCFVACISVWLLVLGVPVHLPTGAKETASHGVRPVSWFFFLCLATVAILFPAGFLISARWHVIVLPL